MAECNSTLLAALQEAKRNGYIHDFSFSEENATYMSAKISETVINKIVPCFSSRATLYLMSIKGHKGTYIHHWEI